jgi:hypothetical protein
VIVIFFLFNRNCTYFVISTVIPCKAKRNFFALSEKNENVTDLIWMHNVIKIKSVYINLSFFIFFFILWKVTWGYIYIINIRWWSTGRCAVIACRVRQFVQPENFSPGGYSNQRDGKKKKRRLRYTDYYHMAVLSLCGDQHSSTYMWIEAEERVSRCYNFFKILARTRRSTCWESESA